MILFRFVLYPSLIGFSASSVVRYFTHCAKVKVMLSTKSAQTMNIGIDGTIRTDKTGAKVRTGSILRRNWRILCPSFMRSSFASPYLRHTIRPKIMLTAKRCQIRDRIIDDAIGIYECKTVRLSGSRFFPFSLKGRICCPSFVLKVFSLCKIKHTGGGKPVLFTEYCHIVYWSIDSSIWRDKTFIGFGMLCFACTSQSCILELWTSEQHDLLFSKFRVSPHLLRSFSVSNSIFLRKIIGSICSYSCLNLWRMTIARHPFTSIRQIDEGPITGMPIGNHKLFNGMGRLLRDIFADLFLGDFPVFSPYFADNTASMMFAVFTALCASLMYINSVAASLANIEGNIVTAVHISIKVGTRLLCWGIFGYNVHALRNQSFLSVRPGMFTRPMPETSVQHCQAKPYLIVSTLYRNSASEATSRYFSSPFPTMTLHVPNTRRAFVFSAILADLAMKGGEK